MTAPPETAIIISPEISLARAGYFSTVSEKIKGKTAAVENPMATKRTMATPSVGAIVSAASKMNETKQERKRNREEETFVKIMALKNVPSIFPKK
ncbi:MAG: hypothetical protein CRN43_12420 [Candidatus Nephrothrix sp. EaCA]|nr:MAG: hypothetical protein CRN43_12420 [Candidatus Nephrothrix sp. EaCA]